ncbi:related to YIH1 Piecemeal microautophagy of the nucleus (PMN) [Phialocephala subalpina]|uniref:Related to YIH1 Piecemeal microautophagy of the nucleus (PMN) n=1 Tax=Phialocephala subalpina TaxID=576137 RepID=A0A1L7XWX4_9HELO|nr:related to YIH1 Piecemeal microautophagy of the nucleus (PMN) [Phialocephala subalpina]
MSEELQNEIEAINSIYGDGTLISASEDEIYVLRLPGRDASLRIQFPAEYPSVPPAILGTQSSGEHTRKGEAAHVIDVFRNVLGKIYQPGEVCLFDAIEEANNTLSDEFRADDEHLEGQSAAETSAVEQIPPSSSHIDDVEPPWTLSEVVVELKSVFIARSAPVSSPNQAKQYLQHLLDSDKKVRSATHNITAWRIKGEGGATFQDCDDDGEAAAGGRVLHLMQLMDLWDVMVVVTRWYGGHQLGPKRFSIINQVARDAFVKSGFVKEEAPTKKKGKH